MAGEIVAAAAGRPVQVRLVTAVYGGQDEETAAGGEGLRGKIESQSPQRK